MSIQTFKEMTMQNNDTIADDLLVGAKAISKYTGFPERRVYRLLEIGELPGKRMGGIWTTSKTAVRRALLGEGEAA